jgi:hypothetical protein
MVSEERGDILAVLSDNREVYHETPLTSRGNVMLLGLSCYFFVIRQSAGCQES